MERGRGKTEQTCEGKSRWPGRIRIKKGKRKGKRKGAGGEKRNEKGK